MDQGHGEGRGVNLGARFLGSDGVERAGTLTGRDGEFLLVEAVGDAPGPDGPTVLYLDQIGSVRGDARWTGSGAMTFEMKTVPAKRERVIRCVDAVARMGRSERAEMRSDRRIVPETTETTVTTVAGGVHPRRIGNISRSGVLVASAAGVGPGEAIMVGRSRGKVVRMTGDGFAVAFLRLVPLDEFGGGYRP